MDVFAVVVFFLLPGVGQMIKGRFVRGIAWLVCAIAGYATVILIGVIIHCACVVDTLLIRVDD